MRTTQDKQTRRPPHLDKSPAAAESSKIFFPAQSRGHIASCPGEGISRWLDWPPAFRPVASCPRARAAEKHMHAQRQRTKHVTSIHTYTHTQTRQGENILAYPPVSRTHMLIHHTHARTHTCTYTTHTVSKSSPTAWQKKRWPLGRGKKRM